MSRSRVAEVEIGIARRRARRIDAGDFEPDAVFESQFEPLVDRDDPAAGAALARAKPVRRSQAARGRKRNHGPGEKNGDGPGPPRRESGSACPRSRAKARAQARQPSAIVFSPGMSGVELIFDRSRMG